MKINLETGLTGVLKAVLLGSCFVIVSGVSAESVADPREVIQELTNELVVLIERNREDFVEDPAVFHQQLTTLMEPVVAFTYIAKNVMGAAYYKQASPEQFARFEDNFKNSLVRTYAKGFFTYNGEEIIVHPAREDYTKNRRVTIVQEIKTNSGVDIAYTMGLNKQGQWKLLNMVVNGVNLGQVLRNQFQQAMEKTNDLDQVINSWSETKNAEA